MRAHVIFSLVVLALVASVSCGDDDDKEIKANGVKVEIMAKGAKMEISGQSSEDDEDDKKDDDEDDDKTTEAPEESAEVTTEAPAESSRKKRAAADDAGDQGEITIEFVSLTEVNQNGSEVGSAETEADKKHKITNLVNQTFTIADVVEEAIPNSQMKSDAEKKISAKFANVEATLSNGAVMTVMVYVPLAEGNITNDGEVTEVKAGQMKFTVKLEAWKWCTADDANCKKDEVDEVGEYLDLLVKVTGSQAAVKNAAEDKAPASYSLGTGSTFMASKKVETVDAANDWMWKAMAEDYPLHEKADDKTTHFTFRFPTFQKAVKYDPSVQITMGDKPVTGSASGLYASAIAVLMAGVLAVFGRAI